MYIAKVLDKIDNGKPYWESQKVGVFNTKTNHKVGEFIRNYHNFGESTFAPFRRGEAWYALYSRSYVALSIMKINEVEGQIEHLGGEDETDGGGFCPVEVYIPKYQWDIREAIPLEELKKYRYSKEYDEDLFENNKEVFYEDFAFISGCHWGADQYWEIQIRDISKANQGIIKSVEVGGWTLPPKLSLKDSIELSAFEQYGKESETSLNIRLSINKHLRYYNNTKQIFDFDNKNDVEKLNARYKNNKK